MPPIDKLYAWLANGPAGDCDQILAAALEHAEAPYFGRIIERLLARGTDAAWAGLIANYELLPAPTRTQLTEDGTRWRTGLTLALAAPHARARRQALAALIDHPCPAVADRLPTALRDTSDEVRRAAACALRRMAEIVLDDEPTEACDLTQRREYVTARANVVHGIREALRTFDLHYCKEVVEVALWFVQDLGAELWDLFGNRRSQCGSVAGANLRAWSGPRLARFLLEALAHPQWRSAAAHLLQSWQEPHEIAALWRHPDVLDNVEIARGLARLGNRAWFDRLRHQGPTLPPEVRAAAPRWLCCLGLDEARKLRLLSRWLHSDDRALQRGSAYAMALLDSPLALVLLAEMAESDRPIATFARWHVAGRRAKLAPAALAGAPRQPPTLTRADLASPPNDDEDGVPPTPSLDGAFAKADEDDELVVIVRDNLDVCAPELIRFLRSTEAQDRWFALRVLFGAPADPNLLAYVERLLHDPVEPIRRLARKVLDASATPDRRTRAPAQQPTAAATVASGGAPAAEPREPDAAALRRELRECLELLLAEASDPQQTARLVQQMRALLGESPRRPAGRNAAAKREDEP